MKISWAVFLREHYIDEAIRRCGRKSSFLQALCLLFVAGVCLSGHCGTNAAAPTNRIRSETIASWFSNVTIITITKTSDRTTTVTEYRSNAVSHAEFTSIKVKAERGDAVGMYQLSNLYGWGVGGSPNASEREKWLRSAAEQGLPEAQLEIGWSHYATDLAEAFRWFRMSKDAASAGTMAQR